MIDKTNAAETGSKAPLSEETLVAFLMRKRKVILGGACAILFVVLALLAATVARNASAKKNLTKLEGFVEKYDQISPESPASDAEALISELEAFANKAGGYASAKAFFLAGKLYYGRKDWENAEKAFVTAAEKGKNTFLKDTALYNAAVAAEQDGDLQKAIEHYSATAADKSFAYAPHARFSVGRLQEKTDAAAAKASYQAILDDYSTDTFWTSLAQSRLIALDLGQH